MNLTNLIRRCGLSCCVLSCFIVASHAQKGAQILGSFVFKDSAFNYEFIKLSEISYTFKLSKPVANDNLEDERMTDETGNENVQTPAPGSPAVPPKYMFHNFSIEVFRDIFTGQLSALYPTPTPTDQEQKDMAALIFAQIKARLDFWDDEPVTAYMVLRKTTINSYLKSNHSNYYNGRLSRYIAKHSIQNVQVEIAEGAIKNIEVTVVHPDRSKTLSAIPTQFITFRNNYPISISAKFDGDDFADVYLYAVNCNGERGLTRYVRLSDFISLRILLDNEKEDYSPANTKFDLSPEQSVAELKKEKRSKILDLSAFTDLVGLDDDVPNGLIQIEASRKLNLNTRYHPLFSGHGKNNLLLSKVNLSVDTLILKDTEAIRMGTPPSRLHYYVIPKNQINSITTTKGTFDQQALKNASYRTISVRNKKHRYRYLNVNSAIEFRLLFSKLDENNRLIDTAAVRNGRIDAIELYRHQIANLGFRYQFLKLHFPLLKFHWNVLDIGGSWSRAKLASSRDSKLDSIAVNSSVLTLGTSVRFYPDSRWGLTVGVDYLRWLEWSDQYDLNNKKALLQPYLDAFLRTNDRDRLFFRFRWTHENLSKERNFTQAQLGYTMQLFAGKNETSK